MCRIDNEDFFRKKPEVLAKDLIGKIICIRTADGEKYRWRIIETEAYSPFDDGIIDCRKGDKYKSIGRIIFEINNGIIITCHNEQNGDNVLIRGALTLFDSNPEKFMRAFTFRYNRHEDNKEYISFNEGEADLFGEVVYLVDDGFTVDQDKDIICNYRVSKGKRDFTGPKWNFRMRNFEERILNNLNKAYIQPIKYYFSSEVNIKYKSLSKTIKKTIKYIWVKGTKDIWLRDFMPVKTRDGRYVSFRYEPSYLKDSPELRTDYKRDLEEEVREKLGIEVEYSNINLDGGNVVMSPSKKTAIISDRVFSENPGRNRKELLAELERTLTANVIIIPSLKSDMTGHADGMVRFVDETTVIGNKSGFKKGLEWNIKQELKKHGISVIDFPYFESPKESAVGTYLNFLETDDTIFLPVFGHEMDDEAIEAAKSIFSKEIVPVRCEDIAKDGGCLNCISWEL